MGRRGHRMPALSTTGVFLYELSQRSMETPSVAQGSMADTGEQVFAYNRRDGTGSPTRALAEMLWRTS